MTKQERQELLDVIQEFCLLDDTYFNVYMEGFKEGMELILRLIVGDDKLKVRELITQRDTANIYGRSVRFDVFVTDGAGREYNIEVQRDSSGASGERARFNSAMLDTLTINKGFEWGKDHLPPAKVIFIVEHDVYHAGKPLYHVERVIRELDKRRFDDKAEIIYVNAGCLDDSPLGRLMHDLHCKRPEEMYYKELADRTQYLKANETGVSEMCEVMERLIDKRADKSRKEGREEGRIETEEATILRLAQGGEKLSIMAMATGWTMDKVLSFLKSRNLEPAQ